MLIQNQFKLTSSKGNSEVFSCLKKHAKKLGPRDALRTSKKLLRSIEKTNQEIREKGIPSRFHLAHVGKSMHLGIFLRPDQKSISIGDFIGIYTGIYELVDADSTEGASYAYDVLQGLHLSKTDRAYLKTPQKRYSRNQEFAIQTNALKEGNFTRFINHSSLSPNVEAVIAKMPDGTMEILLFALKKIHPGEQLLSNYGGQYWAALKRIPDDVTPTSYTLSRTYKVVKNSLPSSLSKKAKDHLMSLRHADVILPSSLEKHPLLKRIQKKLPSLSKSLKKQIDAIEELIIERGLPRGFDLKQTGKKWRVVRKEGHPLISKNTLVSIFSGTLCLRKSPKGKYLLPLVKIHPTCFLCINAKDKGCFTKEILSSQKGNLKVRFAYDPDNTCFVVLLFASQNIPSKMSLSLCDHL